MKKSIFKLFIVLIGISLTLVAEALSYPIQWTDKIKLKSLKEIPALLASKNYVESSVHYINKNNQTAIALSCDDYFSLTKKGYFPQNNMEIAAEGFFVAHCLPLRYLKAALPSQKSFVRSFNLQKNYGLLPAALIFPNLGDGSAPKGDIKSAFPDVVKIENSNNPNPNVITITSKKAAMIANISILGWGDFTHDGYDDLLILVANYPYDFKGSYHSYRVFAVSRKQKEAPLKKITLIPSK